ncbi:DpnII family type II restriction endonuclease [Azospirillum sp. SYSU D00513]|uniref:DpnII family type II restriction endonuclease n=1 Tax=Azospirillum sp. SYSU D00513 TaxID=2812561 RepID=UPI001A962DA2|nr:DpnII family type II restriction endonuclease [Azospirillum sp. SYSU D00513]
MEVINQTIDALVESLSPLQAAWQDATATRVIAMLAELPAKPAYDWTDANRLLSRDFDAALIAFQLFLELSRDELDTALAEELGPGGIGVKRYQRDRDDYLKALETLGLLDAMAIAVNRPVTWSDLLVERLRSGRGKAIRGQLRGRGLENFAETIVREVFGDAFDVRCQFTGAGGKFAKCDLAIPSRTAPRIVIEAKGYGATGSKMTDIIGDVDAIIEAKRNDTSFFLVTDGVTWRRRMADLQKLVERQNDGRITRIYTTRMAAQFAEDLRTLRREYRLPGPEEAPGGDGKVQGDLFG